MLNDKISELEGHFDSGEIACPNCHAVYSRDGLVPLTKAQCPSCGKEFFVGAKVGKYYLQEPLAAGEYSSTYLAFSREEDEKLPVVVKLIPTESKTPPAVVKSLWTEAQVGALLNDTDYVIGCLDHGISNGFYYIVRPYLQGETLENYIARQGKLVPTSALKLSLHLLAGIQHLFRTGFLFRNLTPSNILVTTSGYGVLFGLGDCRPVAEAAEPDSSVQNGLPGFFPPERLLGKGETIASEIYSLGMVLYFMLTGKEYFSHEELDDLTARRFTGKRPPSPSFADFPGTLAIFLDSMLRFIPGERPQDCTEVADSIKALLTELEDD